MTSKKEYNEEWIEYYQWLEDLRQSGITNMFGATPFLREAFPDIDAQRVLGSWMKNYKTLLDEGIIVRND